jgi:RDD family/Protein of unknown function (DUF2510)
MTTGPEPGYYADPATSGYVRYWDGGQWVPGTSRPADPAQLAVARREQPPTPQNPETPSAGPRDSGHEVEPNAIATAFQPIDSGVFEDRVTGDVAAAREIQAVRETGPAGEFPAPRFAAPRFPAPQFAAPYSPFAAIPGFADPQPPESEPEDVRVVELASPGSRVLARIIDLGLAAALSAPATATLLLVAHRHDHDDAHHLRLVAKTTYRAVGMDATGATLWAAALLILFAVAIAYEGYRVGRTGQTAGRRLCGVRVVAVRNAEPVTAGAASARALLFWILALIPLVDVLALGGVFWGRPFAQGWHEKTTRTISIKDSGA